MKWKRELNNWTKKIKLNSQGLKIPDKKIRKIMNIRKKLESRDNMRMSLRESMDIELDRKKELIQIQKEREKIGKVTLKMAIEQKNKDFQYYNKEKEEEHRQQRYNYEKHIYETNREKRDRIRKMTDTAGQKIKAYEAFTKLKNEKIKEKEDLVNSKVIEKKEEELKYLLSMEEDLMNRINKSKMAKKGIEKH